MALEFSPERLEALWVDGDSQAAFQDFDRAATARERAAEVRERARYEGRLVEFRADLFAAMRQYEAVDQGQGSAYYEFGLEADGSAGALLEVPRQKSVLVLVDSKEPGPGEICTIPTIRIFTNEQVEAPKGRQWLTSYFIATPGAQCSYAIGAVESAPGSVYSPMGQLIRGMEEGGLGKLVLPDAPHLEGLALDATEKEFEFPLGRWGNLADISGALEYGEEIIQQLCQVSPRYVGFA